MARSKNNKAHGSGNVPAAPMGTATAVGGGGAPAAGSGKQEYRTASADCAAALDAYYAHTMAFGCGRGPTVFRAAAADPSCVLASALAAPRDPARAAALLTAAAERIVSVLLIRGSLACSISSPFCF